MRKFILILFLVPVLSLSAAMAEGTVSLITSIGTTQSFIDEAVPREDLETIAEAGLAAASAINQQPWFFAIVSNPEVLSELGSNGMPGGAPSGAGAPPAGGLEASQEISEGAEMPKMPTVPAGGQSAKASLGDSPAAIILYKNTESMSPNPDFDCGLACQNMVVAANALGYGTKIVFAPTISLNGERHDEICDLLGVDRNLSAVAVLLIGKVDTDATSSASVRDSLADKTSFIE